MDNFKRLRHANVSRQAEWPGGEHVDMDFRAIELAGETGELLNLIKKTIRLDKDISGTTETMDELRGMIKDELGDALICIDLLGMEMQFDLREQEPGERPSRRTSLAKTANTFMGRIGYLCEVSSLSGTDPAHDDQLAIYAKIPANAACTMLFRMADEMGVDLWAAVEMKFNKTSEKHGLSTRF